MSNGENRQILVNHGVIRYSRTMGKGSKNRNKLPVFQSDEDFLSAFEGRKKNFENKKESNTNARDNEHEADRSDLQQELADPAVVEEDEDFAQLLEASFKKKTPKKKRNKTAMPLKKRLKRYPGVEADLDLHGFTAIGAQVKARSFISSCKQQGFFTVRIIVGKGLHSDLGPVLPDVVEDLVKEMKQQDIVLAYQWEKKKKNRSGALIVYLKQFEQYD